MLASKTLVAAAQIKEESQRLRAPGREPLLATAPPAPGPYSPMICRIGRPL